MTYENVDAQPDDTSDRLTAREQGCRQFLGDLIATRLNDLRDVYGTSNLSPDLEKNVLTQRLGSAIGMLDVEATMPGVLRHVRAQDEPGRHAPLVRLGYAVMESAEASGKFDGIVAYGVRLTPDGVDVINGYRTSMGDPTVQEALADNIASHARQAEEIKARRGAMS